MSEPDSADDWRQYWERTHEGGLRLQVENAARDPLAGGLTAEVPTLVEEYDLDPDRLREAPDAVLDAGREGFAAFVADAGFDGPDDDRYGYDLATIHPTAVTRVTDASAQLADPVGDANTLTHVTARVTDPPQVDHQPAVLTYRCPLGHETSIVQSPYRTWTLDACGNEGCTNAVVPVDRRTRVRPIAEFAVKVVDRTLPCVATGRFAAADEPARRLADADRLLLTGVPRLVTDANGDVEPVYEVLHADPA